ncbi:MAG: large subunit ribosomal protein L6 [Colwellia polaris]|jgi:large subunit ribosomal protein L6
MKETVNLPEAVDAEYKDEVLKLSQNGTEVEKELSHARVQVEVKDDEIEISTETDKRNVTSIVKSFRSHVQNMVKGLENPHKYELKAVYAHFPMTLKKEGNTVKVENFMGERKPREAEIMDNAEVQIDGEEITVTSPSKEAASQTAARIEQLSKKGNRDPRTFQDGIYITNVEDEQ